MAKRKETNYTCTVEYTEGCSERLTKALVEIYYNRQKGISPCDKDKKEETA